MGDDTDDTSLVPAPPPQTADLELFEQRLVNFIGDRGLPTTNVLVSIPERTRVFGNVDHVINKLESSRLADAVYISKFLAAAASGLFDAALNYLWDETIYELRRRVASYDLSYFFDLAVKDPDRRKKLKEADDLAKVEDSELIKAANEIGLVSDLGLRHLDFIRYMRNWASAAHPNQNQITGLQLVAWLETCITEVISLPQSNVVGEIRKILANIRANPLSSNEANSIALFFANLEEERANALVAGFFGLYVDPASAAHIRQNIHLLAPRLWPQIDEGTRRQLGVRYAQYAASGETERADLARQFLEKVGGLAYIPDDMRAAEIQTALQDLLTTHRGFNNFYSEPPFAKRLAVLMASSASLPAAVAEPYVLGLVEVFLTNGNGVALNADPIYSQLLSQLDAKHSLLALLSFQHKNITIKLQHELCQKKFRELLVMVRRAVTAPIVHDLIDTIEKFPAPLYRLSQDSTIKTKEQNVKTVLGL